MRSCNRTAGAQGSRKTVGRAARRTSSSWTESRSGLVQRLFDVALGGDVRLEVGVERTPALNDDASLDQILGRSIRNQPRVEAARRILCTGKRP